MTPPKTAADYAAIAVAPLLIFLMISSLANFLMLILYRGGFPERVSWTLLMFTLGAVGIARVAIERDRTYALGYAGILGIAAFVAMLRFVDSPIFSAFILVVIAYLADVIVRDCTLIDDAVDASGQGLMDSGRLFIEKQIQQESQSDDEALNPATDIPTARENTHQPGRTVMYLALAALPLFGLGQFFLRSDPGTWARAQLLLALYLFSALSLLVTTSFLGLRRYLRQRRVEMPGDVSIAWLAGGLALIAVVLAVAYIAPLPGKALASFELPEFLDSPGGTQASEAGWGDEGADESNPDASTTTSDPNADQKEVQSMTAQEGAPAGDVGDGNRKEGPTGKQDGGDKQSGGKSEQTSQQSQSQPQQQKNGAKSQQNQPSQQQSGQSPQQQSQAKNQQQNQQQSGQADSKQSQSGQRQSEPQDDGQSDDQSSPESDAKSSEEADAESPPQASNDTDAKDSQTPTQEPQQQEQQQAKDPQQQNSASGLPPEGSPSSPPSSSPGMMESVADTLPMIASLIKFLVFVVLAGIVGAFLWMNRHALAEWWNKFFGGSEEPEQSLDEFLEAETQVPQRAFASFRNPIGKESDLRRIVVITFQAFDAWTREHGTPRGKDETPAEFIRRVGQSVPQMSAPASEVVDAYNRIVYGRGQASKRDLDAAQKVWHLMQTH